MSPTPHGKQIWHHGAKTPYNNSLTITGRRSFTVLSATERVKFSPKQGWLLFVWFASTCEFRTVPLVTPLVGQHGNQPARKLDGGTVQQKE